MIAIYDKATGMVRRTVYCPDEEIPDNVGPDEGYIEVDSFVTSPHKVVNGELVGIPDAMSDLPYPIARRGAYPAIGDQLDAIWKALATMPPESVPEPARSMLAKIQAVKDRYPAPAP